MNTATRIIFVVGVVFAIGLGLVRGLDPYGFVILALVLGCSWLGFALLGRTGDIGPGKCSACGGLISPNAPYCKHCGFGQEHDAQPKDAASATTPGSAAPRD